MCGEVGNSGDKVFLRGGSRNLDQRGTTPFGDGTTQ